MPDEQPTFILFRLVRRKRNYKGWGWVLVSGLLLTALALLDAPRDTSAAGTATSTSTTATGSTGCQMQVTSAQLQVRSGPSVTTDPLGELRQGQVVDATTEITDGFRRLPGNRWAANEFLVPVAGTTC
jgi:sirohydrochlorin ferrochelatase